MVTLTSRASAWKQISPNIIGSAPRAEGPVFEVGAALQRSIVVPFRSIVV